MINITRLGSQVIAEYLNANFEKLYTIGFFKNGNEAMQHCVTNYPDVKIYNRS